MKSLLSNVILTNFILDFKIPDFFYLIFFSHFNS